MITEWKEKINVDMFSSDLDVTNIQDVIHCYKVKLQEAFPGAVINIVIDEDSNIERSFSDFDITANVDDININYIADKAWYFAIQLLN